MHETVTIQLGQCGNQLGNEFWSKICNEGKSYSDNRHERFFYSTRDKGMIPRAILIDTEPRAIDNTISTGFNTFLTNEGTGASNNWAHGYSLAKAHSDDILDIINRTVEACNNIEAFQIFHSCAGGTGSGFSSFLAETLTDMFPKKVLVNFSILPNNKETSDVVVQPYNTILCLNKLHEYSNAVVLMDNYALSNHVNIKDTTTSHISLNSVAADVITSFTSPIRFPSFVYGDYKSILNTLVPTYDFNFLIPSVVKNDNIYRSFSVPEIINALIKQKTMLCDYESSTMYGYLAVWNVLEYELDPTLVLKSQQAIMPKINFLDLPFYTNAITNKRHINAAFNNTSSVRSVFSKICIQFDKLKKYNAFLDTYRKFGMEIEEMNSARENIHNMSCAYEKIEMQK